MNYLSGMDPIRLDEVTKTQFGHESLKLIRSLIYTLVKG